MGKESSGGGKRRGSKRRLHKQPRCLIAPLFALEIVERRLFAGSMLTFGDDGAELVTAAQGVIASGNWGSGSEATSESGAGATDEPLPEPSREPTTLAEPTGASAADATTDPDEEESNEAVDEGLDGLEEPSEDSTAAQQQAEYFSSFRNVGFVPAPSPSTDGATTTTAGSDDSAEQIQLVEMLIGDDEPVSVSDPNSSASPQPFTGFSSHAAPTTTSSPTTYSSGGGVLPLSGGPEDVLLDCHDGLSGWTIIESGGSSAGKGTVAEIEDGLTLVEGDSFVLAIQKQFTVPQNPRNLKFDYTNLTLSVSDPTAGTPDLINDAFEVALVDPSGQPLTDSFTAGRDAFLNITEQLSGVATGEGVTLTNQTVQSGTVSLDISNLTPGSTANFVFRLVNNDGDTTSTVTFACATFVAISGAATVDEGSPYILELQTSGQASGNVTSWTIDWGDGSAPQVVQGSPPTVAHTYAEGPTSPTITATAVVGQQVYEAVDPFQVTVNNVAPTLIVGGALDRSFGVGEADGDGKVTTSFAQAFDAARDVLVQADGKLLVVGDGNGNFAMARYNPDGTPDTTFGAAGAGGNAPATTFNGSGKTEYNLGGSDAASAVLIDPVTSKIVLVGSSTAADTTNGQGGGNANFALARFNANGTIDTTFGSGGKVIRDFNNGYDIGQNAVFQPDGNIAVAGQGGSLNPDFVLARFSPAGALLSSQIDNLGNTINSATGMTIDAAGNIIVAGTYAADFALLKYSAAGALIATKFDNFGQREDPSGLVIDSGGKILVSGTRTVNYGDPGDFMLARYDVNFNREAVSYFDLGGNDASNDLVLQADGKIVVVGSTTTTSGDGDFALARFNNDSGLSLDTTFGASGKTTLNFVTNGSGGSDEAALALTTNRTANGAEYLTAVGYTKTAGTSDTNFGVARFETNGLTPSPLDENGTVRLRGTISDPGVLDSFTLNVNWGPGEAPSTYTLAAGSTSFDVTHTYLDDNPTASNSDNYTISLSLADDDGGATTNSTTLTVKNVAPTLIISGALDKSFAMGGADGDGKVTTAYAQAFDSARDVLVQPDGKILVAGDGNGNVALARYNADGTPDTTFGTAGAGGNAPATTFNGSGKTEYNIGGTDSAIGVVLDANGKIIVAGSSNVADTATGSGGGTFNFALARFNANGTIDTSFGASGKVVTDFNLGYDLGQNIALQSDGTIVVAGSGASTNPDFVLARYSPSGTLLSSTINNLGNTINNATGLAIDVNDQILVCGTYAADFALLRYSSTGALLSTKFDNFGFREDPSGLAIDAAGKILVSGTRTFVFGGPGDFMLARYDANLNREAVRFFDLGANDASNDLVIQADGKVVVAGMTKATEAGSTADFALARFNNDSALSIDTTFGMGGKTSVNFVTNASGGSDDAAMAITTEVTANGTEYLVPVGYTRTAGTTDTNFGTARFETNGLTASPLNEGGTVQLRGTFSDPGTLDTFTLTVNWGVGQTSDTYSFPAGTNSFQIAHTYLDDDPTGTPWDLQNISLALADDDGGIGTTSTSLRVNNTAPAVSILGAPATAQSGTLINLSSSVTDPGTLDTFTYAWTVTKDGQPFASGQQSALSFTPQGEGQYVVTLTVSDDDTGSGSDSKSITVVNTAPQVQILNVPQQPSPEGVSIAFGSQVTDPDDTVFTYAWTVTRSGQSTVLASGTESTFSFTPADNESYVVSLTVTDAHNLSGSDSDSFTVGNVAPNLTAGFGFQPIDVNGQKQLAMVVAGGFADPGFTSDLAGTQETFTVIIDWGDTSSDNPPPGVIQGYAGELTRGSFLASHVYASAGSYTVTVTVSDDDGGSQSTTFSYGIVTIDVKDQLNLKSNGTVGVEIIDDGSGTFAPTNINVPSLRFGPAGAREKDGALSGSNERVAQFDSTETGIQPNDQVVFLTGSTTGGLFFVAMDTISIVPGSDQGQPGVQPQTTKFFVVDKRVSHITQNDSGFHTIFGYTDQGAASGNSTFLTIRDENGNPISRPMGIASNAAGTRLWTVDNTTGQVTVQNPDGTVVGAWLASGLQDAQGITTDNTDLWVIDAGLDRVMRYLGAAQITAGGVVGVPAFNLHADNTSPSDIVTDGESFFVVDDVQDDVFVYSLSGTLLGRWELDAANSDASGITLNPTLGASGNRNSYDLWVLDRADLVVYRYIDGTLRLSDSQSAAGTFALANGNTEPEGIADPPVGVPDNKGTDFWIAFPQFYESPDAIFDPGTKVSLVIASDTQNSGTLSIPGMGYSTNFTVAAGSTTEVVLPWETLVQSWLQPWDAEQIKPDAIHVTTIDEVAIFALNYLWGHPAGYTALPTDVLAQDYIVLSAHGPAAAHSGYNAAMAVIATEDNTAITLVPTANIDAPPNTHRPAGQAYTVLLDAGEAYYLRFEGESVGLVDPTGTTVSADKPIGVLGAHNLGFVEQLPPLNEWGRNFLAVPFAEHAGGERLRVLAQTDGTELTINGQLVAALNAGQVYEQEITVAIEIGATASVLAAQYANLEGSLGGFGFPSMTLLPALDQFAESYTFSRPAHASSFSHYINIVAPTAITAEILLDGQPLPGGSFSNIASSGFSGARVAITSGVHQLTGPAPFGTLFHGISSNEYLSYSYPAGWDFVPDVTTTLSLTPEEASVLVGGQAHVLATVIDSFGNPLSNVRVDFNVDGATATSGFAFTNEDGLASFSYFGSAAGEDTITATADGASDSSIITWSISTPSIAITSPADDSIATGAAYAVVSGVATAGLPTAPISLVTVNGTPVDALDASGKFFARVLVQPGANSFTFVATDIYGQTATTNLKLHGTSSQPANGIGELSNVSTSITGEFGRTSFFDDLSTLFADLRIRNNGRSRIGTPLLIGIEHISDPTVRVLNADGTTPTGISTFDYSTLVADGALDPEEFTGYRTIEFYNPNRVQFTFDVVPVGVQSLNRPPVFSTIPFTSVSTGHAYGYDADAIDLDGDAVTFELLGGPAAMQFDQLTGTFTWTPGTADIGNYSIRLRAKDTHGAYSEQNYTLSVVEAVPNRNPTFSSTPIVVASPDQDYAYQVTATDPDGDPVSITMDPALNLTFNPQTRMVSGQLSEQQLLDGQPVTLRLSDGNGGTATQDFTIRLTPSNIPPQIISAAPLRVAVNDPYIYPVQAIDGDFDRLTFSLVSAPDEMTIDSLGVIRWRSLLAGAYPVTVRVEDGEGGWDEQSYSLTVSGTAGNRPPYISSVPPLVAAISPDPQNIKTFNYALKAFDPDGRQSDLSYQLTGPSGMTMDPITHIITWGPATVQDDVPVTIKVTDADGAGVVQRFLLDVVENLPPQIISLTPTPALTAGLLYAYDVLVDDTPGDVLTYTLGNAPDGMTIDEYGRLRWNTDGGDVGSYLISVTVTDLHGVTDSFEFPLTINPDTRAPLVHVELSENPILVDGFTNVQVTAYDNVSVKTLTLKVGDQFIALDALGRATVPMSQPGNFAVVATATDAAGNLGSDTENLAVSRPDASPPTASISSPVAAPDSTHPTVTSITNVVGTASDLDDNLSSYTLTATQVEGGQSTSLATGTTPVTNGVLGQLDPTLLRNGTYLITLTVEDLSGKISTAETLVDVVGQTKVGNFRLAETDLVIPFSGIPITLTRSYDTLDKDHFKDFGHGWKLDLDVDLKEAPETRADFEFDFFDAALYGRSYPQNPPTLSVRTGGSRDVFVTLPGGRRTKFTFVLSPSGNSRYQAEFESEPGVHAKLSIQGDNTVVFPPLGGPYWQAAAHTIGDLFVDKFHSYDIPGYVLTMPDGTKFIIDKDESTQTATFDSGRYIDINDEPFDQINEYVPHVYSNPHLTRIVDANGNRLNITDGGITHSDGGGIIFQRDAFGRISSVTDASGQVVLEYGYDQGDLISVTRLVEAATQSTPEKKVTTDYNYESVGGFTTHRLTGVTSPTGKTPIVNEYDDNGRLLATVDAFGRRIEYTHDLAGRREIVLDRRGQQSVYLYDQRGNVLEMTNPLGETTRYTYDAADNVLSEMTAFGTPLAFTRNYTYDAKGFRTSESYTAANNTPSTDDDTITTTWQYIDNVKGEHVSALMVAPDGTRTENVYNPSTGTLSQTVVKDANGGQVSKTTFAYDSRGNQTSVTRWNKDEASGLWAPYAATVSVYNAAGRMTETREETAGGVLLTKTAFVYDANGNVLSTTQWNQDASGNLVPYATTTNVYDALHRLVKVTDPLGRVTRTIYNDDGQVGQTIDAHGIITEMHYDSLGQADGTTYALGRPEQTSESTTYDRDGHVATRTDRLGKVTTYRYDAVGRLVQTVYPDNTSTEMAYDAAGRQFLSADRHPIGVSGNGTRTSYDAAGRVLGTERLHSVVINISTAGDVAAVTSTSVGSVFSTSSTIYDSFGRVLSTTGPDQQTTTNHYDAAGRLDMVTDPLQRQTRFQFDGLGRQIRVIDALNRSTDTNYDELGRVVRTTFADGSFVSMSYDALGRKTAQTDQLGRTTNYEYDVVGNLTAVVQPEVSLSWNGSTYIIRPRYEYEYDSLGQMTVQRDAMDDSLAYALAGFQDRQTIFGYDDFGRRTSRTLPGDSVSELTSYDLLGREKTHVDFKGQVEEMLYDDDSRVPLEERLGLGRLVEKRYYASVADFNSGTDDASQRVHFAYDALGRTSGLTDTFGTTTYAYDLDSRMTSVTTPHGTLNYEYQESTGRLIRSFTTHDDTHYAYDELGRLRTVTALMLAGQNVNLITTYTYDAVGNLDTVALPNGVVSDYDYDVLNRLDLETVKRGSTTLRTYDYELLANGQRDLLLETDAAGVVTKFDWTYDGLDRLIAETYDVGNNGIAGSDYIASYTYDLTGNRLVKTIDKPATANDETISYTYNAKDQLLTETSNLAGTSSYTYDANGSQTRRTRVAGGTTVEDALYRYDLRNRLVGANTDAVGAEEVTYLYDDAGNKVAQVINGTTTLFLVDSNNPTGYSQIVQEKTSPTATPTRSYLLGHDVIAQAVSSVVQYLLYDGHGSTRALLDATGQVISGQSYAYDAFGNAIGFNATTAGTTLLYSGEWFDRGLGIYYWRTRPYRQTTGTWMQADDPRFGRSADPMTLHKYLYGNANPASNSDPSGNVTLVDIGVTGLIRQFVESRYTKAVLKAAQGGIDILTGAYTYYHLGNWYQIAAGEGATGRGPLAGAPPDAVVASITFGASVGLPTQGGLLSRLGIDHAGLFAEVTIEGVVFNSDPGRVHLYSSRGWGLATQGGVVAFQAGAIWNLQSPEGYEGESFSAFASFNPAFLLGGGGAGQFLAGAGRGLTGQVFYNRPFYPAVYGFMVGVNVSTWGIAFGFARSEYTYLGVRNVSTVFGTSPPPLTGSPAQLAAYASGAAPEILERMGIT